MGTEAEVNKDTLEVGSERYRIMQAGPAVETGRDNYVSRLVVPKAGKGDSGMYICFVTNAGFSPFTYKAMSLTVLQSELNEWSGINRSAVTPPIHFLDKPYWQFYL